MERGLEILTAVIDAFDEHGIRRDDEAMVTRCSTPVTRNPGNMSSRLGPRSGNVVNPLR